MLMMFGASIEVKDFWGRTAFSYAQGQKEGAMLKASQKDLVSVIYCARATRA